MSDKLTLNKVLHLSDEQLSQTKIRLNTYNGETDPLDEFKRDPQILLSWNFYNTTIKNYNNTKYSIGLVDMKHGHWLLFTVAEITRDLNLLGGVGYEYRELQEHKPLFGRLIVKYKNSVRKMVRNAKDFINELEVLELLPNEFTGENFTGYDNVKLSYDQLKTALERNQTYINAFRNQKAVYLITDTNNGKLYVGSATSDNNLLLSRWRTYIDNGHGENVAFLAIINDPLLGFEYIKNNFQYSILENYNQKISDEFIFSRERYWKEVLKSVEFGYNKNR